MLTCITHIANPPNYGDYSGKCVVCGRETSRGHSVKFSDNFVGYSFLTQGDVICEYCYAFLHNQDFRRRSWVFSNGEIRFLDRAGAREVILNPPEPPFYIYVTQTSKRQGWLQCLRAINYSRERFNIATDFVGCVYAILDNIKALHDLISFLRTQGISKTEIQTGNYTAKTYSKAIQGGWVKKLEEAKRHVKTPLWEVLCYVAE